MRYPLSEHDYGAHPAVLPPDDPTRHDGDAVPLPVRLDLYRKMQEMRLFLVAAQMRLGLQRQDFLS